MTPGQVAAMYAREFAKHGGAVTIVRGEDATSALGKVLVPASSELTDSVDQATVQIIVLASLAFAPQGGDVVTVAGHTYRVTFVDDVSRRVAGVLIAYVLTVAG